MTPRFGPRFSKKVGKKRIYDIIREKTGMDLQ